MSFFLFYPLIYVVILCIIIFVVIIVNHFNEIFWQVLRDKIWAP